MRIGIFVTGISSRQPHPDCVSGHLQIPLMAVKILAAAGHDVTLVTTKMSDEAFLPYGVADVAAVCTVQHASAWPQRIHFGLAARQVGQLWSFLRKRRFDVIHFFGGMGTGLLLCTLMSMGVHSAAFFSPMKPPPGPGYPLRRYLTRWAFTRVRGMLTTAEHVGSAWASLLGRQNVAVLRPGVMKQCAVTQSTAKDSVLFWRTADYDNGVDEAIEVFRTLAPRYPSIRFVFAVRATDRHKSQRLYRQELLRLGGEGRNIEVYLHPYRDGISLEGLLGRACLVVQPFRRLSINPQMSILESLYAGVPVIATAIESNPEVVLHEQTGLLVPPGDRNALLSAIDRLLKDAKLLASLARNARPMTEGRWNWDSFGPQLLEAYASLC
jgi:glycosyltransferase involved in cell wall biosynthesis